MWGGGSRAQSRDGKGGSGWGNMEAAPLWTALPRGSGLQAATLAGGLWQRVRGGARAMLYLGAEPERCPPHRRGVSERRGGGQRAGRGLLVMVTGRRGGRRPSSLPVGGRAARKDFRRRQVIVQHRSSGPAASRLPLQHTQLRSAPRPSRAHVSELVSQRGRGVSGGQGVSTPPACGHEAQTFCSALVRAGPALGRSTALPPVRRPGAGPGGSVLAAKAGKGLG